ncbi:uncharacterized protein [Fopius arisanus]|uniref:Sri protein n=1 Tax=Fopius arisanus TaxID=64838 RepID=A0A0C9S1Z2_9HYME|nr:PREDICTED: uncharacterized protein LOC105263459 [Fopius arisanus]
MALWDRKIHWQFGGNVEPVRTICEIDWKSCPSTILNYLWSEIVTDVIDYVTVTDGILWRLMTLILCLLVIIYAFWTRVTEILEDIVKDKIVDGINFKIQSLETRVNVLAYRMQYGLWPLPANSDINCSIGKGEYRGNSSMELLGPTDKNWLGELIPECIVKKPNFGPNKSHSLDEALCGVYDRNRIFQKINSTRKSCKKGSRIDWSSQSKKHGEMECRSLRSRKSMGIQCQGTISHGEVQIPLTLQNSSSDITKLFKSTGVSLGKVRHRLEGLRTVLKTYRNGVDNNMTRKETAQEVNLLDDFLQELSDLQSSGEGDAPPVEIREDFKLEPDALASVSKKITNSEKRQIPEEVQCEEQVTGITDFDNEVLVDTSGDSLLPSKNRFVAPILDNIIEEQSGNSCNEQSTDCDERVDQKLKSQSINKNEVGVDDSGSSKTIRQGLPHLEESSSDLCATSGESRQFYEIISNPKGNADTDRRNDSMLSNIYQDQISRGPSGDDSHSEVNSSGGVLSDLIICSSASPDVNAISDSIIESESSVFMKLEKIKFDALREVENSWSSDLFGDKHLKFPEPLILKSSFTGINFTINVLSDDFRGRIPLGSPEKSSGSLKTTLRPLENNFQLNKSPLVSRDIERSKSSGIPFIASDLDLTCLKRKVRNNQSKSSSDLSPRRIKLPRTPRTYRVPKRPKTPQISADGHRGQKIYEQHRSSSLDCIRGKNLLKTKSKSGIPVLKSRVEGARKDEDRPNPRIHICKNSKGESRVNESHSESAEQTVIYINIINEQNSPTKMESSQEFSDYVKENIFKIRGLTEYIKNSGVSKIVTIVCSTASQSTDDLSKEISVVPRRKFVIDTNTLMPNLKK